MPHCFPLRKGLLVTIAVAFFALLANCGEEKPSIPEAQPEPSLIELGLPLFQKALQTQWPAPSQATRQTFQALAQGNLAGALNLSASAFSATPNSDEAAYTRGVMLYLSAGFGAARPLFERVMRNGPSFAGCERVFYFYGVCLIRLGEGALAREALQAQLTLQPDDSDSQLALGELNLQEGNQNAALKMYQQALSTLQLKQKAGLQTRPAQAKAQAGMGNTLLQMGQHQKALSAIQSSIDLDPTQAQPYYALSRIYMKLGKNGEARNAFTQFKRLSSGS